VWLQGPAGPRKSLHGLPERDAFSEDVVGSDLRRPAMPERAVDVPDRPTPRRKESDFQWFSRGTSLEHSQTPVQFVGQRELSGKANGGTVTSN
jgi:hypothetical protein